MDEIKAKQQVVEKIKEAGKILVTVSDDPSVDALSAALGLTLLLDKQEKYATSIFSGHTPPAIAFLEPEKTFDDTTDSLRDFIIALNKEKADHLRYKIEGDAVRIFITPYKTTIDQSDLEFSQGDYNVELVIALGVKDQDHLDKALENHGQILHDATIITITAGDESSDLGGIDWHDANSSSISEMIVGLAEALKEDKKKSLLDGPISTALLTGIVAQTDRFSNEHTTSKVMTVAASLMAAGADQQLIANELQRSHTINVDDEDDDTSEDTDDDSSNTSDDGFVSIEKETDPTSLSIVHEGETLAELDERIRGEKAAHEKIEHEIETVEHEAKEEAEKRQKAATEASKPTIDTTASVPSHAYAIEEPALITQDEKMETEPTFGGTLNATTDQAEDDARKAIEDDKNRTILTHSYIGDSSAANSAVNTPSGFPGTPDVAPGSTDSGDFAPSEPVHSAYAFEEPVPSAAAPVGGERVIQPITPPAQPVDLGLPLPPPVPDFSQGLSSALPPAAPSAEQPKILGDILAPEPPAPTTLGLDYETTNTHPAPGSAYAADEPSTPPTPPPATPGQFQIPGQQ